MRHNRRISTTLRLFFVLIAVLPLLLISFVTLRMYKQDLLNQNTERSLQTAQAVSYSVEQEISRMVGLFASIGVDQDVLTTASRIQAATGIEKQNAIGELRIMIEKYTASVSGKVLGINFFFNDGGSYSYLKNMLVPESEVRESDWYKQSLQSPDRVHFLGMMPNMLYGNFNAYMMGATISPRDGFNPVHNLSMMLFMFESGLFDNILQNRDNEKSVIAIVTQAGRQVASNTLSERGSAIPAAWISKVSAGRSGSFVDDASGDDTLITYAKVEGTDWSIVQQIPVKDLIVNYRNVSSFVWFVTGVVVLAVVLVSMYFVSSFTKPIRALLRQMVRVTGGDLDARINVSGGMELVKLGQSFNHMTERVQELIVQREIQEKEKSKAEFAALQSQINPHFLINTLNAIKFMALMSKADNIRKMTHALTGLLQSTMNRGGDMTTVADEMEHLKNYLYIMEIRFGRSIQTEWRVEKAVSDNMLLKLLLQPIVENSIIHGLKDIDYPARLDISATTEGDDLIVEIADNGAGMPDRLIEQLPAGKVTSSFSGMGIANVHQRIRLHYGTRYGLSYSQNEPRGTKAQLRLPLLLTDVGAFERTMD
ncbi:sensor histidine kinase [Cohnella soli]|uniref:histidine kinase n=1 Tax=Cohnella soli TaxID=425005 RepID=A0ABW0HT37_9BACL